MNDLIIFLYYKDISPLENYHLSEAFKILLSKECNVLERFNPSEFRLIRKRMIEAVLATDMTNHSSSLSELKKKIASADIFNGNNIDKLINDGDDTKRFNNQQIILNNIIHTADISNPAKISHIYKKWVNLVFEEFFYQGDLEKNEGLQISTLCDRHSTDIVKSQIGFIKFVVKPSFDCLSNLAPGIKRYLDYIQINLNMYEEEAKANKKP